MNAMVRDKGMAERLSGFSPKPGQGERGRLRRGDHPRIHLGDRVLRPPIADSRRSSLIDPLITALKRAEYFSAYAIITATGTPLTAPLGAHVIPGIAPPYIRSTSTPVPCCAPCTGRTKPATPAACAARGVRWSWKIGQEVKVYSRP